MSETPWDGRQLHFVGIGGAGMSGLAVVAQELGASVTGSDRAESAYLEHLRSAGLDAITVGHDAALLPEGEGVEVVYSTAIPEDNPELAAARERRLRVLHRGELLAEVAGLGRCIAVSGTHGKTTTTAMLVHVLGEAGVDPGYLVGAELPGGGNARWGSGEWIVVEADESDRSLLNLDPEIAVLTNLELDHHSTYSSLLDLEATMREFLAGAAHAVVWDRPELRALRPDAVAFDAPSPRLEPAGSWFEWAGQEVWVPVPGAHNALNAAAALEAVRLAGVEPGEARAALASFRPAGRRFEHVGATEGGAEVYDDYAHHPTEVEATLLAARTLEPRRVVAAFQPHLYSRTAALWREFGQALALADAAVVLDVYRAREDPSDFPGVSGLLVAEAAADAADGRPVAWLPGFDEAEGFLRGELGEGDLLLTLGAGDVDQLGRRLVE